jgi:DNA-binding NarL/FixJ family response regulator
MSRRSSNHIAYAGLALQTTVQAADVAVAPVSRDTAANALSLIDGRHFVRDCVAGGLEAISGRIVFRFGSIEEWVAANTPGRGGVILLCDMCNSLAAVRNNIKSLRDTAPECRIIVLSEIERADHVLGSLEQGARGYITTSMPLEVAAEAIRLVERGGTFVPACSFVGVNAAPQMAAEAPAAAPNRFFTARQTAVVEALRRGKANKIIAYELKMRESTVKVHVRNIMKKLNAKNRTEVAFKTADMQALQEQANTSSSDVQDVIDADIRRLPRVRTMST